MELQLTKEEYQELLRFVKVAFKHVDKDELGDDWWHAHIGYDVNIYYDEWEDGYKACAYAIFDDGTTDTSTFTVITYLF